MGSNPTSRILFCSVLIRNLVVMFLDNFFLLFLVVDENYDFDRQKELTRLFEAVGGKFFNQIGSIYLARIDRALKERWNPRNILKDIIKGYKLTGHGVFLEKKLTLLEQEGKYDKAGELAMKLGKPERARVYNAMHQMIQEVKAPRK